MGAGASWLSVVEIFRLSLYIGAVCLEERLTRAVLFTLTKALVTQVPRP